MWTVIYVAQSREGAIKLQNMLSEQGVLVKIRRLCKNKNSDGLFEVLVPQIEVEDACSVLEELSIDL